VLLLDEVRQSHDAKQLLLSAFLCVYCVSTLCFGVCLQPCFIACDSLLQESLPFFAISLKRLCGCLLEFLFVLSFKLDDGIRRFTADVQLVGYITDSNPSLLLNQNINSFNIVHHS